MSRFRQKCRPVGAAAVASAPAGTANPAVHCDTCSADHVAAHLLTSQWAIPLNSAITCAGVLCSPVCGRCRCCRKTDPGLDVFAAASIDDLGQNVVYSYVLLTLNYRSFARALYEVTACCTVARVLLAELCRRTLQVCHYCKRTLHYLCIVSVKWSGTA